jgi:hypothetical protein
VTSDDVSLRPATPSDSEAVAALIGRTLPQSPKADTRVLRWQYWQGPYGQAVSWVCERSGELVAHLARVPVPVLVGGRRMVGAISADAVTCSAEQRHGLHALLRDATNRECCERGIPLAFHFRDARSPLPRGGPPSAGHLARLVVPLDAGWLADRAKIPRFVAAAAVRRAGPRRANGGAQYPGGLSVEIDALWMQIEDRVPFGIVKDASWWRWRYEEHPGSPYLYFGVRRDGRLAAAAVASVRPAGGTRMVTFLEFLAADAEAGAALGRAAASAVDGAVAIAMLARLGSYQERVARRSGMRRVPRLFDRRGVQLCVRDTCGDRPELVHAPWSATLGDSDGT